MKKDDKLEQAFDEYFEGVPAPKASVTESAKNSIRQKKTSFTGLKHAAVIIASVASACASSIGLYFAPTVIGGFIDKGNEGGENDVLAPSSPNGGGSVSGGDSASATPSTPTFYGAENLLEHSVDIYAKDNPEGLEFLKKFDMASNSSISSVNSYSTAEGIAFVKTELTVLVQACRHDLVIYAEYTAGNTACEIFEDYYAGLRKKYDGLYYLYSQSFENGEYLSKTSFVSNGVKYYLSVKSSDENAYADYFDIILKKQ